MDKIINESMLLQPVINIGMIGHVANGKSSIVKELTGIATQKYSSEKQKNITIKLGYANAKIYRCNKCKPPECFQSGPGDKMNKKCIRCDEDMDLITHVSFVDCPGHTLFTSTMLNGTSVMDTTILVEAVNNETLPAPQTIEHINAITMGNIPNSIVCLNKFDLIKKDVAVKNIEKIRSALANTVCKDSVFVPVSATFKINIDVLCDYISQLEIPKRDLSSAPKMVIVRSFNINKPGVNVDNLYGGVVGGSLLCGILRINDSVELLPGYLEVKIKNKNENMDDNDAKKIWSSRWKYMPLKAKVISINSENTVLQYAIPGGLIGVQLDIDPALTATDGMIGQVLTFTGSKYNIYEDIAISYVLMDKNILINKNDKLQLNINACNVESIVVKTYSKLDNGDMGLKLQLVRPIAVSIGDKVVICSNNKILGLGNVLDGRCPDLIK